jgi:glycosyltransferase involved in cell wall biosynthesis
VEICFFNRSYWPDQAATGQLLTELAEDLVGRHGCSVAVVAGPALHAATGRDGREEQDGQGLTRRSRESHGGVQVIRAGGSRFAPTRFVGRATNYLTYFASATAASFNIGAPDVVVSLTDPPIIGLTALFAARRTGARFVFLCEDIFPEVAALVEDFHNRAVNATLDRINRYLLREADAVVALGDRMRRRLVEEKAADPARIHVIHNWADCEAITPEPKDTPFARAHDLVDRFVVMHSGNVGLSQNLDVLIEAADRLRSKERLVIAIVGGGSRREALERMVADRGLTNVRFFPYQSKSSLHESFGAADAFVVSLKDTLEGYIVPSKVYGILAAGRPYIVAANPTCEAATIATEGGCGLIAAPGDAGALAAAIASLYDDPAATRAMGERARRAAWQFDRRVAVQAYHDLFARIAGVARAA